MKIQLQRNKIQDKHKKIVFMHIPKTAGSSVNEYFTSIVGSEKSRTFAEHDIYSGKLAGDLISKYDFVSGHFFYGHVARFQDQALFFTVLRDPYKQLVSQIKWLDRYNLQHNLAEKNDLSRESKDIIEMIGQTDLGSVHQLDELLVHLPPYGYHLLNNLQSRFIIGDSGNFDPLSLRDIGFIAHNLKKFDYFCTLDQLSEVVPQVAMAAGYNDTPFDRHANRNDGPTEIDLRDPIVRKVLEKHILVDLLLYDMVENSAI